MRASAAGSKLRGAAGTNSLLSTRRAAAPRAPEPPPSRPGPRARHRVHLVLPDVLVPVDTQYWNRREYSCDSRDTIS